MYKFLVSIFRILFKILYRVEIKGQINIDGHYMICANHIHRFDPVFIACFTKRPISFMAKKEAFDYPIVGKIIKKCYAFPVDREKGDIFAMKTAISILETGNVMSMFPEGTRSKTGELGEFKKGAAFISYRANVPIIPMKIEGNYKVFSKLILKIGEPIYPIKDKNEMTELLRQSIENL